MWQKVGIWLLDKATRALIANRESIVAYIIETIKALSDAKLSDEERKRLGVEGVKLLKKLGSSFVA